MAVYVDDMYAPFGRMKMCHMVADTTEELLAMADACGVQRKWIQNPGTWKEHFDVSVGARRKAVTAGAIEVSMRELAALRMCRREKAMRDAEAEIEQQHPRPKPRTVHEGPGKPGGQSMNNNLHSDSKEVGSGV